MIHAAALAGVIIWLGLNGLLRYMLPSDLLWLLGSSILGAIFFFRRILCLSAMV